MHLFRTDKGPLIVMEGEARACGMSWDHLVNRQGLRSFLETYFQSLPRVPVPDTQDLLAPIGSQEVWAAGVTYERSKLARMDEAEVAGGGDFYDRVYLADRPELFFKSAAFRVSGPGQEICIRRDSAWNVPEPELALFVSSAGTIEGFSIGNDVSSRSIEGENPLYLPQAKTYDGSCALGPALWIPEFHPSEDTRINLNIVRNETTVFSGTTQLGRMKRGLQELTGWLFHSTSFPTGCYLLTGTGIVPPDDFTLHPGDEVLISIDGIGSLNNRVR